MEGYTKQSRTLTEYLEQVERNKFLEILECEKQFKANPVPDFIRKKECTKSSLNNTTQKEEIVEKHNILKKNISPSKIKNNNLQSNYKINSDLNKKTSKHSKESDRTKIPTTKPPVEIRPYSTTAIVRRTSEFKEPTFTPKINKYIPDHDQQYKAFLKHFAIEGRPKSATVCKPFNLRSPSPLLTNKEQPEKKVARSNSLRRGSTGKLIVFMDAIPPRMTQTALLRCANIKVQKSGETKTKEKEIRSDELKRLKDKDLEKIVQEKAFASNIDSEIAQKLKSHRQSNRDREINYRRELENMKNKLKERPLLLEQNLKKKEKTLNIQKTKSNVEIDELSMQINDQVQPTLNRSASRSPSINKSIVSNKQSKKQNKKTKSKNSSESSSSSSSEDSKKSTTKNKKSSKVNKKSTSSNSDRSRKSSKTSKDSKRSKSSSRSSDRSRKSSKTTKNLEKSKSSSISTERSKKSSKSLKNSKVSSKVSNTNLRRSNSYSKSPKKKKVPTATLR